MKIKSIVSALLAVALTAALAIPAFAASGINADEQRILDTLDTEVNGVRVLDTEFGAAQYADVRAFLMQDGVDLDAVDANNVITIIWQAIDVAAEAGITTYAELMANTAVLDQLTALAAEAIEVIGADVELVDGRLVPTYNGRPVSGGSGSAVKQTGVDFTATWAVLALVVAATAGCAVFVKKSRVEI